LPLAFVSWRVRIIGAISLKASENYNKHNHMLVNGMKRNYSACELSHEK